MPVPKTLAQRYEDRNPTEPAPIGTVAKVEVIVFKDASVYVGCPQIGPVDHDSMAATLAVGLGILGHDITLGTPTRAASGQTDENRPSEPSASWHDPAEA